MVFKSSEIRWFSKAKDSLWNAYEALAETGIGKEEEKKADRYLQTCLFNTGIKFSEGAYDIKVKAIADREFKDHGMIEHWIKWSMDTNEDLSQLVGDWMLKDWISVEKKRNKKAFTIENGTLSYAAGQTLHEGCAVEFVEIYIPSKEMKLYSFAMDAFSSTDRVKDNLNLALEKLDIDFSIFDNFHSFGYPELLSRIAEGRFKDGA